MIGRGLVVLRSEVCPPALVPAREKSGTAPDLTWHFHNRYGTFYEYSCGLIFIFRLFYFFFLLLKLITGLLRFLLNQGLISVFL